MFCRKKIRAIAFLRLPVGFGSHLIYIVFEAFSGFKCRRIARRNFDLLTGLRILTFSGFSLA